MSARNGRKGLASVLWRTLRTPVAPQRRFYLAIGWLILALFAMQVITGILLSAYYEPTPERATESIRLIMRNVGFGWLVRGLHHWCTTAILILGALPLVRIFVTAAYRREGTGGWHLAAFFLLLLFAFAFTGQLLPWDAEAYWTSQRILERVTSIPFLGPSLSSFLSGSEEVAGQSLKRIHATHVLVLPWLSFLIVVAHLWLLVKRPAREVREQ